MNVNSSDTAETLCPLYFICYYVMKLLKDDEEMHELCITALSAYINVVLQAHAAIKKQKKRSINHPLFQSRA